MYDTFLDLCVHICVDNKPLTLKPSIDIYMYTVCSSNCIYMYVTYNVQCVRKETIQLCLHTLIFLLSVLSSQTQPILISNITELHILVPLKEFYLT